MALKMRAGRIGSKKSSLTANLGHTKSQTNMAEKDTQDSVASKLDFEANISGDRSSNNQVDVYKNLIDEDDSIKVVHASTHHLDKNSRMQIRLKQLTHQYKNLGFRNKHAFASQQ